jgi:hypothetical protein
MPPQVVFCEPGWPVLQGFEHRSQSVHVLHSGAFCAHAPGATRARSPRRAQSDHGHRDATAMCPDPREARTGSEITKAP